MPRRGRSTPVLSLAVAVAVGVGAVAVAGCSDDDGGDDAEDVGSLETVVQADDLAEAVDVAAGGDGVWVATGEGRVLEVSGDGLAEAEGLDAVSTAAGIAASDDGTLFAADPDRPDLDESRDHAVRIRTVADHVTELPHSIDRAGMGEDRIERHEVAVDVREDRDAHRGRA